VPERRSHWLPVPFRGTVFDVRHHVVTVLSPLPFALGTGQPTTCCDLQFREEFARSSTALRGAGPAISIALGADTAVGDAEGTYGDSGGSVILTS
jgi:hypothetical protein